MSLRPGHSLSRTVLKSQSVREYTKSSRSDEVLVRFEISFYADQARSGSEPAAPEDYVRMKGVNMNARFVHVVAKARFRKDQGAQYCRSYS